MAKVISNDTSFRNAHELLHCHVPEKNPIYNDRLVTACCIYPIRRDLLYAGSVIWLGHRDVPKCGSRVDSPDSSGAA